jgi:AraC-like DNA-binding protein
MSSSNSNSWPSRRAILLLGRGRDMLADIRSSDATIRDIAREAGMSHFHFIRRFEAVFGETPHQFRIREKLMEAQRLLAHGRSVTEACLDVGFTSVGSFSTLFKRNLGVTPSVYQRQLRRPFFIPDWAPHPPNCFLWMGGPDAIAIFEKTTRAS